MSQPGRLKPNVSEEETATSQSMSGACAPGERWRDGWEGERWWGGRWWWAVGGGVFGRQQGSVGDGTVAGGGHIHSRERGLGPARAGVRYGRTVLRVRAVLRGAEGAWRGPP